MPLSLACEEFLRALHLSLGSGSRADFVANFLLFVPLTFLAMGAWAGTTGRSRYALAVAIVCLSTFLSAFIEFTQVFFPTRTASLNDILAESVGGVAGIVAWFACGRRITSWAIGLWRERAGTRLAVRILSGYLIAFTLYQLLPFDLTLQVSELAHKLRAGRIVALPFGDAARLDAYTVASKAGGMIPIGFLCFLVLRPGRVWRAALAGMMFAAGIELLQVFVYSRYAIATDVVWGLVGSAVGAAAAAGLGPTAVEPWRRWGGRVRGRRWIGLVAATTWAAALVWYRWPSLSMSWPAEGLGARFMTSLRVPFYYHYFTSEDMAAAYVVRSLTGGIILGMLVRWAAPRPNSPDGAASWRSLWPMMAIVAAFALLLEAGLLFVPKGTPDITTAAISTAGGIGGVFLQPGFCRHFLSPAKGRT